MVDQIIAWLPITFDVVIVEPLRYYTSLKVLQLSFYCHLGDVPPQKNHVGTHRLRTTLVSLTSTSLSANQ